MQITLFVCSLLLEVFKRCVFLQVCKLAGYLFGQKWYINEQGFGIQERVSSNKE